MSAKPTRKKISLALQGGGALGAFTWGVLDFLLEDERVELAAISGASAGAMSAVVLADGYSKGGEAGARAKLRAFWEGIAEAGRSNPYRSTPLTAFLNSFTPAWMQFTPMAVWADLASRVASPYALNPLNINPLKEMLEELVDFDSVRACETMKLFVSATNVETGRIRVFRGDELTADHVMASACLPLMFQAVEIDGAPYWDGGYAGNPALFPLFEIDATRDILIVQIHPIERPGAPRTAPDIIARLNEITFNESLMGELRAIDFVGRLMDQSRLPEGRYRKMLIHKLSDEGPPRPLSVDTAFNTDIDFFRGLYESGRKTCRAWLKANYETLGVRSTIDLRAMFEGDRPPIKPKPKG